MANPTVTSTQPSRLQGVSITRVIGNTRSTHHISVAVPMPDNGGGIRVFNMSKRATSTDTTDAYDDAPFFYVFLDASGQVVNPMRR